MCCSDWHNLSETICVSFSVFIIIIIIIILSNIYLKIKIMAKNWSDLRKFYSKVIF